LVVVNFRKPFKEILYIQLQQPQLRSYQLIGDSLLLRFAEQILHMEAKIGKLDVRNRPENLCLMSLQQLEVRNINKPSPINQ
jgi:hypothetical protein